ncbi:hypothetical protein J4230_05440 [Candidatus Woesearchaeota archaeon]|nr:hypothetical protein [Candidatus Woesearchaeota archaeon]
MKFKINKQMFEKFEGLNIGIIIAKNIINKGIPEDIINKIKENEIRKNYKTETLSEHPKINCWRKAYSIFGGEPKKNKSSIEALYRRILNGEELRHINKLVDAYNFISLKYMLPIGGEDIDKIEGDVELTFAKKNEPKTLLLGDKEQRSPHEGEVIYKDKISAICRRWNWREAERTKLTEDTKNCIIVIEGVSPIKKEEIEKAILELKEIILSLCGGKINYHILDKNSIEIEF